jgi:hypothetical protein
LAFEISPHTPKFFQCKWFSNRHALVQNHSRFLV